MKFNKQITQTSLIAFVIAFSISFFLTSCESDPSKKIKEENVVSTKDRLEKSTDFPEIKFEKVSHDFGEIKEGVLAETVFTFTNVGKSDLIISNASGSCGCTVPKYPKNIPIKPGENGEIEVNFDTNGRPNLQQKMIKVSANTPDGGQLLRIQAFVESKNK